jgi:hypothetical protein
MPNIPRMKNDSRENPERRAGAGLYRTDDDLNPAIIAVASQRTSLAGLS